MNWQDEVLEIISEISEIDKEGLGEEQIIDELGIDSLDMAQIVFRLEDELNLKPKKEIEYTEIGEYKIGEFLKILKKVDPGL